MELTKLEINGFKSFGDKVSINFDEGITGIVGPNGCGKSNIVDAIRWVLGEQKMKSLRSGKMENVIFNGTKKRKPTQLAEVSLTFNNTKNLLPTEYSEVTITRKYFRSGVSEYLLNQVPCRLKDITNLFLDTGIGPDSYAIIELAMIEDILNDKDNSRRTLFEEAAGISKYKSRKKETLRKLGDTDADLERVEDLLYEIDQNLKSLEKQARQAERYNKIKEDYKDKSILLARASLSQQNDTYINLKLQIEKENDKKVGLNKKISQIEAGIEKSKADMINKEKLLSKSQKTLNDHVNKIRHYESDKQIKNERLKYLNDKSESLQDQLEQDKKSKERAEFSIKSLQKEKEDAERVLKEIKNKQERLNEEFEEHKIKTANLEGEFEALGSLHRSGQEEVYHLVKSFEINEIQLSSLKSELEKTASDTTEKSASLIEFENKLSELQKNYNEKTKQLEKLKKSEENLQQRIENTQSTIEVIREEHSEVNRKLDARQNEYNLTKSMIDNLEGFPEAIRFLRMDSEWGKKTPLLSDIISCPEDYKITIENYLEPVMNYYVTKTDADAIKAINLLSNAAKGKANFFILDRFKHYKASPVKIYDNAFPASEIAEYDKTYSQLVSYILDKVYITVDDIKDIPNDDESIFITKNGKITKRKFSISGGSVGLFEGKKIGRIKNLEKLDKELKKLTKKLVEIEKSRSEKESEIEMLTASTYHEKINELHIEITRVNEELISIKTKHEQFFEMLSSSDLKKEDIQSQIKRLANEIKKLKPETDKKKAKQTDIEQRLGLLNEDLQKSRTLLEEKSSAFNQENIFFHQQENRVTSINQEINYKKQAFDNSKQRIGTNQEELEATNSEIKSVIENTASNDNELVKMYDEKENKEAELNQAERNYYHVRGEIDEKEKQRREIQHTREASDAILMELQNALNETKLELNSVKERLAIEFNIDLTELIDGNGEDTKHLDKEELEKIVFKFKDRMEKMGPINPMAMEAYEEIQQRNEFISSQKEDLIKAKDSLLTTIDEIDLVAKAAFLDAFYKIEQNFIKVFRSLFTEGDECDLHLLDPENPLESNIEIIAKPKGKKPLSINQLSGGEKTLTATSLLFAIYLLKPAPFCIFDEVDAPLDDANIDKFNHIIKKFSTNSQFIIITHNKRTMASTDIIYGITMIEQGVSRVVPVDLKELD